MSQITPDGRRARFRCEGSYYGVDYAKHARSGVSADERPARFVPDGTYPANDLSWYANIPVPTSYMAMGCRQDFSGGYDHKRQAGVVYVANHHIAPGKKQWTWGNQEFGYAWDRNLTDSDGPYIELMAGAYTDNQPDFSFLAPGETRTFSQYWVSRSSRSDRRTPREPGCGDQFTADSRGQGSRWCIGHAAFSECDGLFET